METGDESATAYRVFAFRRAEKGRPTYKRPAFREECRVKDYPLYVYLTYKGDDLFRNGSAHE